MSTTVYGMPYLLEDRTGQLTGSDYIDMNDRLRLCQHDPSNPLIALAFGPNSSLGTITLRNGAPIAMEDYLAKLQSFPVHWTPLTDGHSNQTRKFLGSDGREYRWSWRTTKGHEWTCTNQNDYVVASYSLKVAGEPDYLGSSGCMLTIDEAYPHLAAEFLASLTIMRHMTAHGL